jgi:hypothetical protein
MFRLGETGEMLTTTRRLIQDGSADVARRARLLSAFAVSDPLLVESAEDHERLALWQQRSEPVQFERILLQSTSPFVAGKTNDLRVLQRTMSELPMRSPVAAGILSGLVPGLGQAYVGAWQSAAVSLVLNALFLGATVELFRQGLPASAAVGTLVFSVTYVGNIINAAQSATLFNNGRRRAVDSELERQLFPELRP